MQKILNTENTNKFPKIYRNYGERGSEFVFHIILDFTYLACIPLGVDVFGI